MAQGDNQNTVAHRGGDCVSPTIAPRIRPTPARSYRAGLTCGEASSDGARSVRIPGIPRAKKGLPHERCYPESKVFRLAS